MTEKIGTKPKTMKPCVKCGGIERNKNGQCAACKKVYQQANREKIAAYNKIYGQAHHEKRATRNKAHYQANHEKALAYQKAYQQANPEKIRTKNRSRRARLAKVIHRPYDFKAICDHYGNVCLCCGRSDLPLTVDHIKPITWGGADRARNIQPLCASCNSSKGNYHATDYRPDAGALHPSQLSLPGLSS